MGHGRRAPTRIYGSDLELLRVVERGSSPTVKEGSVIGKRHAETHLCAIAVTLKA